MKNKLILGLLSATFAFSACSSEKDGDVPSELTTGSLAITFDNKVGGSDLVLNTENYTNSSGETYSVSTFRYIISNIVLIDENGSEFIYPEAESYFIINEEDATSTTINLSNIDGGKYSAIRFGIGVPQTEYPLEGANFIPKAEALDMIWSWSAGYIFLKLEGEYSSSTTQNQTFLYHMGSHGSNQDNYREVQLQFPEPLVINDETQAGLVINTDVAKIFDSKNTLSLDQQNSVQVDPVYAPKIADNFSNAFSVAGVE